MGDPDLTFRALFRDMPLWIKVMGLGYFVGVLGIAYVAIHFIAKLW